MLIPNKPAFFPLLTLSASLLVLPACDRAKPHSYTIPKEERTTTPSTPKTNRTAAPANMQILPGMAETAQAAGEFQFNTPAGWQNKPPSGIRKAELSYDGDSGSATITVTVFPGDVGGLLANINRWRGQVGLPAMNANDLHQVATERILSKHRGTYVRLLGEDQSILGGLLPFHGKSWFFKMSGDTTAILSQEDAFSQFLDSIAIEDPHH